MDDGVGVRLAANQPLLRAAAPQQGAEVVCPNQNAAVFCQRDHLLWSCGGIEGTGEVGITFHLVTEVIQCIQKVFGA